MEIKKTPENDLATFLEEIISLPLKDGLPRIAQWQAIQLWARKHLSKIEEKK